MFSLHITNFRMLWRSLRENLNREDGMETIEKIGLGAVIMALIGAIIGVIASGGGETIGQAIVDVIVSFIEAFKAG